MNKCFSIVFCVLVGLWLTTPQIVLGQSDSMLAKLDAEKLEQSGTAITIIFDDSGSMAGEKLSQAKDAFRSWLQSVPSSYRIRLVTLNHGELVPFGRDNKDALLKAVAKIQAKGGTELIRNIKEALATIDARRREVGPYERHILLVFTDGAESTSAGDKGVQNQLKKARNQNVETVGIGYQGDGDYMAGVATRYFNASNGEQLKQGLAKVDAEIGDTSDIEISPQIHELMKSTVLVDPNTARAAAASKQVANPSVAPSDTPQPSNSFQPGNSVPPQQEQSHSDASSRPPNRKRSPNAIVAIFIAFIVIRAVLRKAKA